MKRYLLFICDKYEPSGGMRDFRRDFDTLAEAVAALYAITDVIPRWDKGHIWDCEQRKIIKDSTDSMED